MKSSYLRRATSAFAAFMTLEGVCNVGLVATPEGRVGVVGHHGSVKAMTAFRGAQPADVKSVPLRLTLHTPSGGMSQLTFVTEDGWRLEGNAAPLKLDEARISPASTERQWAASGPERPMSVFIDGPTGFTYVWVADQGWRFVGQLSRKKR